MNDTKIRVRDATQETPQEPSPPYDPEAVEVVRVSPDGDETVVPEESWAISDDGRTLVFSSELVDGAEPDAHQYQIDAGESDDSGGLFTRLRRWLRR